MAQEENDKDLMGQPSAHGFGVIDKSNKTARFIKSFLTLSVVIAFSYHLAILSIRYRSYPKSLQQGITEKQFLFPDLTFCPMQEYALSRLMQDGTSIIDDLKTYYKHALRQVPHTYTHLLRLVRSSFLREWDYSRHPQDQVIYCEYQNKRCDFRNFTVFRHPTKFGCFTFSPDDKLHTESGPSAGLRIILNLYGGLSLNVFKSSVNEYKTRKSQIDDINGYEISIHAPRTKPSFSNDRIIAQGETLLNIGLEMHENIALNTPQVTCTEDPGYWTMVTNLENPSSSNKTFKYTALDCRAFSRQDYIVGKCGCLDDETIVRQYTFANSEHRFCNAMNKTQFLEMKQAGSLKRTVNLVQSNLANSIVDISNNTACQLREIEQFVVFHQSHHFCPATPCRQTSYPYRAESSYLTSPSSVKNDFLVKMLNETITMADMRGDPIDSEIRKHYIQNRKIRYFDSTQNVLNQEYVSINIYPTSLNLFRHEEVLMFPFPEFVGTVGGILGLWVGFSVMTVFEFMGGIGRFLVALFVRPHQRPIKNKRDQDVTERIENIEMIN